MNITSQAKTIRELLINKKYKLDYYQREYSWQTKHVKELITDLTQKFSDDYKEEHGREEVENYGHYFLGPIIINQKGTQQFIIDGQQRLTTLTLLIMNLYHMFDDTGAKLNITGCIFSEKYGKRSFNLDVQERERCMDALHRNEDFNVHNHPESVRNIVARYNYIKRNFPKTLQGQALPYFVDWLLDNVHLATITVDTDRDAYMIFETMNDRGLSLTPTEMLRGYLLSNITDAQHRDRVNKVWHNCIQHLQQFGKNEGSNAIKAWLRSQYATRISDFDSIGTKFHRWIREGESELGLASSDEFVSFVEDDFKFYSNRYQQLLQAAKSLTPDLECVYYNANFTLQFPVLLAPLLPKDTEAEILQKIQIVSRYLDIFIHRRIWNFHSIAQNTMVETMFSLMHEIRGKSTSELTELLSNLLRDDPRGILQQQQVSVTGRKPSKDSHRPCTNDRLRRNAIRTTVTLS